MTASFTPAGVSAVLMGDESLTIACGDMFLAGGHHLVAVVTRDESVERWAQDQSILCVDDPLALIAEDMAADWLLSIANLRMIPAEVLALPKRGAINFHDGPLPRYAGLNTPAWAIMRGEKTHGVSWHVIEGGVDEGDLLAQTMIDIAADETAFSLNSKCYAAGMESFAAVLAQLEAGTLDRQPQDLTQRSYFARDQRPDGLGVLDFSQPAEALCALVRGLDFGSYWNPLCVPKLAIGDQILRVGALLIDTSAQGRPGEVLSVTDEALILGTATAAVRLSRITTLTGAPVELSNLCSVGQGVSCPTLEPLEVRNEGIWRKALAAQAHSLPLCGPGDAVSDLQSRDLVAEDTLGPAHRAAAAALVCARSSGSASGFIGLAAGRSHPLAASWVPVQVATSDADPFEAFAQKFATQMQRADTGHGVPHDLPLRDPSLSPLSALNIALSATQTPVEGAALTLCLGGATPRLVYDAQRLSPAAVALMANRFEAAFAAATTAKTCAEVWAMPQAELIRQSETWNATTRAYERATIHAAFEAQVARTPDAAALVFETETLSFDALNRRANQLAHVLRNKGAGPGTPIALCTARDVDLLVGALGILKAGGAYVPLDPSYPADRIAHYIKDSAAPLIVTQKALAGGLPDHAAHVVLIDADPSVGAAPDTNPPPQAAPDDLAYLIYTSGSTGTPKGVMVSHGNVANFFAGMDDRIDHASGSVWLAVTSLSFDISVLELFWTLSRGFKLILAGDESRTLVSNGPIGTSDRRMDFNLMYWGNDDGVGPKKYELLLEGAKFADAHGFNAVWTPERHFHAFGGPYPNPAVTGAAVAAVTRNLSVRAGSCVAPLHHPARIAEDWGIIDNLTNGRAGLAIASGWQPDDFILRPENTPPDNKPAMYEAIAQLRKMWRGEPVAFPKKDGTLHEVVTQPRPVSRELPIWVTTAGNPQTWKEAGEIGANVLTHLLGQSIGEVADKIRIYRQALRDAGHDPDAFTVTLMLHTYLADSRAASEEVARGPMKDYLRSAAALIKQYAWAFPAFKRPEGTTNAFDLDLEGLSDEELDAILEFAFQRYFNESGLFGTVADGVARAEELKRIGVDEIACLIDYGIDSALVLEGLKPLAQVLAQSNQQAGLAEDDFSLAAQIVRHDVTHLQCTPSMAQMLVTNDEARLALGRIDHLLIGGEALPGSLVDSLRDCTGAKVQNMYGPTETTIWSTTAPLTTQAFTTAPIGTPVANTQIFILDDSFQLQPIGVEGNLWIGGDGVTQGYWQRDALTAERFVDNPFGKGKLYATGDLAAWDADGTLHFAGRADAQVKIRGHRIELGEIEARLAAVPQVTQAVVVLRDTAVGAQLVGYVTATAPVDEAAALKRLSQELPAIMVPTAIVTLQAMPLTPNKKIDRKALPVPAARKSETAVSPAGPTSGTQAKIAAVWSTLLGVADIRGADNFFALGGHSLLAVQAHRDIRQALGLETLSITDIFRFPTLEGLAGHIDKGSAQPLTPSAAPTSQPARAETMSKRRAMRAGRSRAGA